MSTNFKQEGRVLPYTAPTGGLASGAVQVIRSGASGMIGVSLGVYAAAATAQLQIEGVFSLAAESGTGKTFSNGDVLYWDAGAGKLTKTATGNTKAGFAFGAKTASATTALVKINA